MDIPVMEIEGVIENDYGEANVCIWGVTGSEEKEKFNDKQELQAVDFFKWIHFFNKLEKACGIARKW